MEKLKKIFKKYESEKENIFGKDDQVINIDFDEFSLKDKIEIIDKVINYYDPEKDYLEDCVGDLDVTFVGGFNIASIKRIKLSEEYFYIHGADTFHVLICISDLKLLREYYNKKSDEL